MTTDTSMLQMVLIVQILIAGIPVALLIAFSVCIYGSLFTKKLGDRSSAFPVKPDQGTLDQFVTPAPVDAGRHLVSVSHLTTNMLSPSVPCQRARRSEVLTSNTIIGRTT
jgi:hypothetical protein